MVLREYTIIFHLLDRFISFNINYAYKTNPTYWIFVKNVKIVSIKCYLYIMIQHFLTCISETMTFCMKVLSLTAPLW